MTSVLLVDDHEIMRAGLKAILRATGDFLVVGEAENGVQAVQLARRLRPQVVVMDISLPELNGLEATAEILRYQPETRVVILSMYGDETSVIESLRAGARAFVLKKAGDQDLLDALRTVARGGSYLSRDISDRVLERIQKGGIESVGSAPELECLSRRERQVMRLIAEGKTSKEIAVALELGVETVRGYRKSLMRKLGVSNVAALTQLALRYGLATPGPQFSRARAAGASQ
jgi:two-component system response regulator NreC